MEISLLQIVTWGSP